ncbi:hypothetical protein [Kitasatospora sp. GAS204B]|uniref:hypothetical protein n=1 Tax=unclassified Kitasatospora TaxID=2633591 RepID=UPI0024744877|nr:hypothetical protein [Kitasatospora sp. GAS204B]MDH6119314.1 hypothetical protein [Kitasatospora sp. GAS204B]
MQIAIGDVVRDRSDMALGTVTGVARQAGGSVVVIQVSGGELRQVRHYDLEVVARGPEPKTVARGVVACIVLAVSFVAGALAGDAEMASGGSLLLAILAAFGSSTAVMTAVQIIQRVADPRRISV